MRHEALLIGMANEMPSKSWNESVLPVTPLFSSCSRSLVRVADVCDSGEAMASATRRAMRSALAMSAATDHDLLPSGIYTIPEIATVGPT